jgi:hypothetical protein
MQVGRPPTVVQVPLFKLTRHVQVSVKGPVGPGGKASLAVAGRCAVASLRSCTIACARSFQLFKWCHPLPLHSA